MTLITKYSAEHCSACRIVDQRMRAANIDFTERSTDSQEFDKLMDYLKEHKLIIRNAPVVTLEKDGKIQRVWSGVFDINELKAMI